MYNKNLICCNIALSLYAHISSLHFGSSNVLELQKLILESYVVTSDIVYRQWLHFEIKYLQGILF